MIDTEKIIDGLIKARNYLDVQQRTYESVFHTCNKPIKVNAFDESIAAIDEANQRQKAKEPEVEVLNEIDRIYRCPTCHKSFFYEKQKYCDQCGQAIKWYNENATEQ